MLAILFGGFLLVLATGMPIAFSFLLVCIAMAYFIWGGEIGIITLVRSISAHMTRFVLLPLPLFILMGEVIFHSGIAPNMIDALDKWLGQLPGRLGLLAVSSGTLLATLTGASMGSTAILGSLLTPEMEKRGYGKSMSLGPILGSGGLAIMIPPSGLAVFLGALAEISIGNVLVAIIIPGIVMAALYAAYIIFRCKLQPSIAPSYTIAMPTLAEKSLATVKYILPIGVVIFLVIGVILLGVATPSEAAATGALGTFLLAAAYRRLNWKVIKKSVMGAFQLTVLVFTILLGAYAFAQILAFSGAGRGLANFIMALPVEPIVIFIGIQLLGILLGMFITPTGVMTIIIPIFMPVIIALGFEPVWFAVIMLLNVEMATTTPPFGSGLYVMKGVAPPGTTMGDCYRAALPFLGCDLIAMALIIAFPPLALWLPSIMR
jgi:tripartite ATP-independent transporter DctM subunit